MKGAGGLLCDFLEGARQTDIFWWCLMCTLLALFARQTGILLLYIPGVQFPGGCTADRHLIVVPWVHSDDGCSANVVCSADRHLIVVPAVHSPGGCSADRHLIIVLVCRCTLPASFARQASYCCCALFPTCARQARFRCAWHTLSTDAVCSADRHLIVMPVLSTLLTGARKAGILLLCLFSRTFGRRSWLRYFIFGSAEGGGGGGGRDLVFALLWGVLDQVGF